MTISPTVKSLKKMRKASDEADARFITAATLSWMTRVGAIQSSIRKFVVKTIAENGYPKDIATLRIGKDRKLTFKGDETCAPTKDETAIIEEELEGIKFPESIPASISGAKAHIEKLEGVCSMFLAHNAEKGKEVLFVEQRIEHGEKKDIYPWSFWNDGVWRMLEPDGKLPVFGMNLVDTSTSRVIVHEGVKAARYIQALVDNGGAELAAHPWAEALRSAVHIAWPGGTERVRSVDWETIKKLLKGKRVIFACDNDQNGINAVRTISSILRIPMSIIQFGDAFPDTFDLGDNFSSAKNLWEERKGHLTWIGPSFEDCLSPATWATNVHEQEKGKPPIFSLRKEFASEWMFSIKPLAFVNRVTLRHYARDEFNVLVAPFSDVKDVADKLHKWQSSAAETLAYEPGKPSGRIASERKMVINLYRPSDIEPAEGDVGPWIEFLEYLIPDEGDRMELMKWIATLVARPDVRMHYSILLISEMQGVGKTTLAAKILAPLVGMHNCSFPTAHEATESEFTSWLLFKRLAIIGELYDGESSKAYNRMKDKITDPLVRANEKHEKPYNVANWTHVSASSNSFRALKIAANDRRWFLPGVTEEKRSHAKWVEFNEWLALGGLEKICFWARDYVKKNGYVHPGVEAPDSAAKKASVIASLSDGEKLIHDLGTVLATEEKKQHVVRLDKIRTWLAAKKSADARYGNDGSKYLETPETIARTLRNCGLKICKRKFVHNKERFQVVANFEIGESEMWASLSAKCLTPEAAYALIEDQGPI